MAVLYLFLALLIQNSLTETIIDAEDNEIETRDVLKTKPDVDDVTIKDFQAAPEDWMDAFIGSSSSIFPTSSAALMAQATFSDKSPEEQLEDIKDMANEITKAIQSEMANLLAFAISCTGKEETDDKLRNKRSVETPMDSSQLVMRLLKHIKSNNDYQNIAIEKMMSAQEIADKYGIAFTPDPETLSDLALAANEQAKEMSTILKDACELKNNTHNISNSEENEETSSQVVSAENINECVKQNGTKQNNASYHIMSNFESPDEVFYQDDSFDHSPFSHYNYYQNYPVESQIMSPPSQHNNAPVSQRPSFYDFVSCNPMEDYFPYCSMEPITSTTIILPIDEPLEAEPELLAEEFEETVSSKVFIDHEEEPGVSTVNHVMSYTLSEKAHYRTPQIESLPQQMQYYFLLM